jgi:hypothetical protein
MPSRLAGSANLPRRFGWHATGAHAVRICDASVHRWQGQVPPPFARCACVPFTYAQQAAFAQRFFAFAVFAFVLTANFFAVVADERFLARALISVSRVPVNGHVSRAIRWGDAASRAVLKELATFAPVARLKEPTVRPFPEITRRGLSQRAAHAALVAESIGVLFFVAVARHGVVLLHLASLARQFLFALAVDEPGLRGVALNALFHPTVHNAADHAVVVQWAAPVSKCADIAGTHARAAGECVSKRNEPSRRAVARVDAVKVVEGFVATELMIFALDLLRLRDIALTHAALLLAGAPTRLRLGVGDVATDLDLAQRHIINQGDVPFVVASSR